MSAPSLPDRAPTLPGNTPPPPGGVTTGSAPADGSPAPRDIETRAVHGTLRLPDRRRKVPTWLKWLPVLLVPAGVAAMLLDRSPDPVVIRGEVGRLIDPSEVLPVFTEIDDDPVTPGQPGDVPIPDGSVTPTPDPTAPGGDVVTVDPLDQIDATDVIDQNTDAADG